MLREDLRKFKSLKLQRLSSNRDVHRFWDFFYRQIRSEHVSLSHDPVFTIDDHGYFYGLGQLLYSKGIHRRLFGSRTLNLSLQRDLSDCLEEAFYRRVRTLHLDRNHVRRILISESEVARTIHLRTPFDTLKSVYSSQGLITARNVALLEEKLKNDIKTLDIVMACQDTNLREGLRAAINAVRD